MTDDELEAIEARANAATPGPWEVVRNDDDLSINGDIGGLSCLVAGRDAKGHSGGICHDADAVFCATARTDIPALIAEVQRLTTIIETQCGVENVTIGEITIRNLSPIQADEILEAFSSLAPCQCDCKVCRTECEK